MVVCRVQQLLVAALGASSSTAPDPHRSLEVYADAARQILRDGAPAPPVREALLTALGDASATADVAQRAWQFRRTLEGVLNEVAGAAFFADGALPIDFGNERSCAAWEALDDRIMGGASISRVVRVVVGDVTGGAPSAAASFEGELVVEGGGFASVRYTLPVGLPSDVDALELEAAGDGRLGYKLTMRSAATDGSVSYQHALPALRPDDGFVKIRLRLADFKPTSRGRPAPDAPQLRATEVRSQLVYSGA